MGRYQPPGDPSNDPTRSTASHGGGPEGGYGGPSDYYDQPAEPPEPTATEPPATTSPTATATVTEAPTTTAPTTPGRFQLPQPPPEITLPALPTVLVPPGR